jgi:ferrous iron transport protein B
MLSIGSPTWLSGALILGVYRVLAWVVSVMLPPMAIFFPLFTILEDLGYLPRIAFNLDSAFKHCNACGKQALTMCMGFGCNAVGVTGCRIIDSRRERLIAIITNVFVPCNGRFPTLIAIITLFFVTGSGFLFGILSALSLTLIICLGIFLTFLVSFILSKTLLKGVPSAFTLELPPYRTPQFTKIIARSITDRTLFVLGRAVAVAAPAGLVIWTLANVSVGSSSLLLAICDFLEPFASLCGIDGVILFAFILGFPANEIVIPIMVMAYTQSSTVMELEGMALRSLLLANGWTAETAICVMLFCICHWPCSTTLITIYKETKSKAVTLLSAVIPTLTGIILCMLTHLAFTLF